MGLMGPWPWAVMGYVPWLIAVEAEPTASLLNAGEACMVQIHRLGVWLRGCSRSGSRWCEEGGRAREEWGGLGCHGTGLGGLEALPLVIENGGLVLPFGPGYRHWTEAVDALPKAWVEGLLEMVHQGNVPHP